MSATVAIYRLKEDDPSFGMKAGDLLLCTTYHLDPHVKGSVIARITDGFNPDCTVYWNQVEKLSVERAVELLAAAPAPVTARSVLMDAAADAERHLGFGTDDSGEPCLVEGDPVWGKEVTVHSWLRDRAKTA